MSKESLVKIIEADKLYKNRYLKNVNIWEPRMRTTAK